LKEKVKKWEMIYEKAASETNLRQCFHQ